MPKKNTRISSSYLTTYLSTLLKYSPISDSTFIILFHILFTLNSLFIFSLTTCTFLTIIIIIFFFLCSPLFICFRYNLSTFDILSFLRWSTILRFQLHPLITIWQLFLPPLITFFIPFIINFLQLTYNILSISVLTHIHTQQHPHFLIIFSNNLLLLITYSMIRRITSLLLWFQETLSFKITIRFLWLHHAQTIFFVCHESLLSYH